MKTYATQGTSSLNSDLVWAFDLGKDSIGEAARQGMQFLHKASLLIPGDIAKPKLPQIAVAHGAHSALSLDANRTNL